MKMKKQPLMICAVCAALMVAGNAMAESVSLDKTTSCTVSWMKPSQSFYWYLMLNFAMDGSFDCTGSQPMTVSMGSGGPTTVNVPPDAVEVHASITDANGKGIGDMYYSTSLPPYSGTFSRNRGPYYTGITSLTGSFGFDLTSLPNYRISVEAWCQYPGNLPSVHVPGNTVTVTCQ
jgi:hypothetical protein